MFSAIKLKLLERQHIKLLKREENCLAFLKNVEHGQLVDKEHVLDNLTDEYYKVHKKRTEVQLKLVQLLYGKKKEK